MQQAAQPVSQSQGHLFQGPTSREWVEIDIRGVRVERSRQFGGCGWDWLLRKLGLPQLLDELLPQGREGIGWSVMAQILVLGTPPVSYGWPSIPMKASPWWIYWECRRRR